MPKTARQDGDLNRNGQRLVRKTTAPGTDHGQHIWIVVCERQDSAGATCGFRYGSNGSDFFQRKCPRCQKGAPGPSIEGLDHA